MSQSHVVERLAYAYEVPSAPEYGYFGCKQTAYLTAARMMISKAGVRCKYDIKQIKRLKARLARYLAFVDERTAD